MNILNKKGFKLPRLEKQEFVEIVKKAGIGYKNGFFFVKDYNNEKTLSILSAILEKDVAFTQTCSICQREFPCEDCKYYSFCSTRDLPLHCICQTCRLKPDLHNLYVSTSAYETSN